jgi:hypothetical protein
MGPAMEGERDDRDIAAPVIVALLALLALVLAFV